MYEAAKLAGLLLAPLTDFFLLLLAAGACVLWGRLRAAVVITSIATALLWTASLPVVAQTLMGSLESEHPALPVAATPSADAIVVLGGTVAAARPPMRPGYEIGPTSQRVWHAADLYRAGKAKWIVIAAGGLPPNSKEQVEAAAIEEMLVRLGVPAQAIRRDDLSRNTRENAANSLLIAQALGARRVLLVTSASHMPRALRTFSRIWGSSGILLTPSTANVTVISRSAGISGWLPHAGALIVVTRAIKEYAGAAALGFGL